jgi:capsule biosynthesis phosphatase
MRICIDLDGVICRLREPGQEYSDLEPISGAIEKVRALKAAGHYIIIHTARHMKTCQGNVGQVIARQGAVTLDWLKRHGVPYDEIHFGKPHAQVYLDDNALRFESWSSIAGDGSTLPVSAEDQKTAPADGDARQA